MENAPEVPKDSKKPLSKSTVKDPIKSKSPEKKDPPKESLKDKLSQSVKIGLQGIIDKNINVKNEENQQKEKPEQELKKEDSIKIEPDQQVEEEPMQSIDQKLAGLMQRGWVMLSESCPLETCRCPLMKSPDGQKYCVSCEVWIFDKEKRKKKKFNEIVLYKHNISGHEKLNKEHILNLLNNKFNYLTVRLTQESDECLMEQILKDMNLILDVMEKYKKFK